MIMAFDIEIVKAVTTHLQRLCNPAPSASFSFGSVDKASDAIGIKVIIIPMPRRMLGRIKEENP